MLSGWNQKVAVLTWRMLSEDLFIYIVEFLGQFHVNADFFAARKKDFVVMLH